MEQRLERASGHAFCERVLVADSAPNRMKGLLGKATMADDEGLLLRPCAAVQTWFMRFPVDVVFLDRDLEVLSVRSRVAPWRSATNRRAKVVLEVNAGKCEREGLAVGERLRLVRPSDAVAGGRNGNGVHSDDVIRVVLATADPRFLRVASFLLARHGFAVEATREPAGVVGLVQRQQAHVAVLDGSESLSAAARATRALRVVAPNLGVVVVSDNAGRPTPQNLPVLAKWASFDVLVGEIRAEYARTSG